jgi:hypothetical protein
VVVEEEGCVGLYHRLQCKIRGGKYLDIILQGLGEVGMYITVFINSLHGFLQHSAVDMNQSVFG